jgi:hypothetical protein
MRKLSSFITSACRLSPEMKKGLAPKLSPFLSRTLTKITLFKRPLQYSAEHAFHVED